MMFASQALQSDKSTAEPAPTPPEPQERMETQEQLDEGAKPGPAAINWNALVEQVKSGDDAGMEQLYKLFSRGIRYYLCRQLGPQELEDKVHDTFLIVVNAIKRGDLREPDRLMGFVRTVVRRQVDVAY